MEKGGMQGHQLRCDLALRRLCKLAAIFFFHFREHFTDERTDSCAKVESIGDVH